MSTATATNVSGPTSPRPSPPAEREKPNRFRATIVAQVERLRRIENPTVEEIEMKLFWEAYLASPEPLPRALQSEVSEPIQSR